MERTKTYVGIDIGKRTCVACIMDADGNVLKRSKYPNTRDGANKFIDGLAAYDCAAVCESTARMWIKTYEEFERRGIHITLANPLRLKMAQSGVKTDRIDAQKLANTSMLCARAGGPPHHGHTAPKSTAGAGADHST
ncbi:MAG: transposase [Nitrosopumilaceae archaeon]|nr:transposase [Nitrosopumilaceae archaeon]